MKIFHKTFSSTAVTGPTNEFEALDLAITNYLGRQTVDSRTVLRELINYNSFISGTKIYVTLVVKESYETGT